MNREDRALEAYIQAVLPERERWLYQHALNKVRVITRSMNPAEKAEYLNSEAFRSTLRQLQRRDRIWQGLLRGELVLSGENRLLTFGVDGLWRQPADTTFSGATSVSRCSLSLCSHSARVSRVPYTGAGTLRST